MMTKRCCWRVAYHDQQLQLAGGLPCGTGANASYDQKAPLDRSIARARSKWKRGDSVSASHAGKVYRRPFLPTRLAATLLADGRPCFAIFACPALVFKRDCSYISIHFSLEIAEISSPIASSGKSSGDSK